MRNQKKTPYGVRKRRSWWWLPYSLSQWHFIVGSTLLIGALGLYQHYLGYLIFIDGWQPLYPLYFVDFQQLKAELGFNLAYLSQLYVFPHLALGLLLGPFKRFKRTQVARKVASARSAKKALQGLSWQEFEVLTAEIFREQGYSVENTVEGADGGVDVIAKKKGEIYVIQCKHWNSRVGVAIIREMAGIVAASGAAKGYVVASGGFTLDAIDFARSAGVELMAAEDILHALGR